MRLLWHPGPKVLFVFPRATLASNVKSPFTDINPRGVEGVFSDTEVTQLLPVLTSVREQAAV